LFRTGLARAFFGHEATVPLLPEPLDLDVEHGVAVMLADDLWRATEAEAAQAILGYTLRLSWRSGASELQSTAVQLGPVLVTRDEVGTLDGLRMQLRVEGAKVASGAAGGSGLSPAEVIAWISQHVPLRAGDVIGVGSRGSARGVGATVGYGARIDFAAQRLGRLSGRATRGPAMRAWRRASSGGV